MKIVIQKITREVFHPKRPVHVMISIHAEDGTEVERKLLPANLFEGELVEGKTLILKVEND